MGNFAEAVAALQTAVGLDPSSTNAWTNLGHAYLRNREVGKAIFALQKAIGLVPESMDAHFYLAQAYLGTRQAARAREEIEKVLSRAPDMSPALAILVLAQILDGKKDEALASYNRLKAIDPAEAQALRKKAISSGMDGASILAE
jgi:tetratricopeptide (TPR) repeat protein